MIKKFFYGWWIVTACFFMGLYVGGIVNFSFTAFFEPLVKEFGWSYTQISFAQSLRGIEMSIFAPLLGLLVDRFGSRKLVFCGTITAGFGLILLSMTQSLVTFYASFFLLSFGAGGCTPVVLLATIGKWFDKNVGKAFGIAAAGFGAGGLLVPLVVHLIDLYHWRTTLIIFGFGMWILGIPLSFVIRDKPEQYGYLPDGESSKDQNTRLKKEGKGVEVSLKEALRQRTFLYLGIVEFIRHMLISAVVLHVMPYLSTVSLTRSTAGKVAASLPLLSMVGRLGFGWLGDLLNKKYTTAGTLCLMGAGLLAFCFVQEGWVIPLFIVLFSLGWGGSMILMRTILRQYSGRDSFGRMLGFLMGAGAIGGIIGPTFAGWVYDTFGNYQVTWLIFCGFSGLSIWLILKIKPLVK
jgi:MFS transporter, OFA family, oxalate/formate antiporter